jgi:hypothetical protein
VVVATEVTFLVAPTQVTDDMDELPDIDELDIMDELPIDEPLPMVKTPTCDWLPAALRKTVSSRTSDESGVATLTQLDKLGRVQERTEDGVRVGHGRVGHGRVGGRRGIGVNHRGVRGVGRVVADVAVIDVILQHIGDESGVVAGVSESGKGLREEKKVSGFRVTQLRDALFFRFGVLTSLVGAKTVLLPAAKQA